MNIFTTRRTSFALTAMLLGVSAISNAQLSIAYDNTTSTALSAFSSTDLGRVAGDTLSLASTGLLDTLTVSLFNSGTGNTGSILGGRFDIEVRDNTIPYASGAFTAQPLLGAFSGTINFGTGLLVGQYTLVNFTGLSALSISLPTNVIITQKFTMTSGTSLRYGFVGGGAPTVGTSPNSYYLSGSTTAAGLYTTAGNAGNPLMKVGVVPVPEPASMTVLGLGLAAMMRRRKSAK